MGALVVDPAVDREIRMVEVDHDDADDGVVDVDEDLDAEE